MNHIDTIEDLAVVKQVIVSNVAADGMAVLNAADPFVAAMADTCPGQVSFFALDPSVPVMARHRARGLRNVYCHDNAIVAAQGVREVRRIALKGIVITDGGRIAFQVENVMAAVAAAWALGLSWEHIEQGLASFDSDASTVPGRFNRFTYRGATVIADYGHNPDAILALSRAIEVMPAQRRHMVISAAGDRRDEDIIEQAVIVGQYFDEVILYQDAAQRGRADGEVLALLRQGLANASRARSIEEIRGEFSAIDRALSKLEPGDVCLILIDQVEEAMAHLAQRIAGQQAT
jgi:cyanophycin synthetase